MAAPRVRVPALRVRTDGPCATDPDAEPCAIVPATPRHRTTLLSSALPAAAAAAYTAAQMRVASPPAGSPLVADRFFGDGVSLYLPAATTALYLTFCVAGPRLMAARKPLSCKAAMMVYNVYQAAFNAACVAVLLADVRSAGCSAWGNALPPSWRQEARFGRIGAIVWLHYNNKARRGAPGARGSGAAGGAGPEAHEAHKSARPEAARAGPHARVDRARLGATGRLRAAARPAGPYSARRRSGGLRGMRLARHAAR